MIRRPWFLTLAAVTALLVLGVLLVAQVRVRAGGSRLPERGEETRTVPGLAAPVQVRLDRHGAPHVVARDEADLWFAEGYLHARDRFFQMEVLRRTAAGRLAEIFGEAALAGDRRMRTLRLQATARRQAGELAEDEAQILGSYAAGVNAALAEFRRWIAPELGVLGVDPEAWQPEDTLAIGLLLQLHLTNAMSKELERARELAAFGRQRAVDLWGWSPSEAAAWIPPGEPAAGILTVDEILGGGGTGGGSNSWAVAGARTETGRPLVANDPHLGVTMPGTWYAIHLRAGDLDVAGVSLAGAPGVLIGHNRNAAWGFTMVMLDDQDLRWVTLDEGGSRERIEGRWRPLQLITEEIPVRGREEPEILHVKIAATGPLIRERAGRALALEWTGYSGPSPLGAFLRMDRARTVEELADAWSGVIGPAMNLVAADDRGHLLYQMVGLVPVRDRGFGRLPAPEDDPSWSWHGFRSLSSVMRQLDPAAGFVATANQDLFSEGDFPASERFPAEFEPPWRERRIRAQLSAEEDWDLERCVRLQGDVTSLRARAALQLLRPDLEKSQGTTAATLLAWDGRMDASQLAPHVFARFMLELGDAVGGDEARRADLSETPFDQERLLRLLAGAMSPLWWDVVGTPGVERRAEVIATALERVDEARLHRRWGRVHSVFFRHPFLGTPVLGPLLGTPWSRGPYPVGGDASTVDALYWSRRRPYRVTALPSMRFVTEVGRWDDAVLTLPVGESGRPWSPHYDDQAASWLRTETVGLPFSEAAVAAETSAALTLEPAGSAEPASPRPAATLAP